MVDKIMQHNNHSCPNISFWNNKKVLITGHSGFKGSWLSLWLSELGANITGISLPPENQPNLFDLLNLNTLIDSRMMDIRKTKEIKKLIDQISPDIIFHLAAQPLVIDSYKNPKYTWETNVMGTISILESLKIIKNKCIVIFVTTDKVYKNRNWNYGYRENDILGGHDPYSSSKAASEIAIASWRSSYFNEKSDIHIASARAGNVIAGGDWSSNRIIPDIIRSLSENKPIMIRNPNATRPWQHVLESLSGYILLAENLHQDGNNFSSAYNFGPNASSNKSVLELAKEVTKYWPGEIKLLEGEKTFHEANKLNLVTDKSFQELKWKSKWDFEKTIERTITWYKNIYKNKKKPIECCLEDIKYYTN